MKNHKFLLAIATLVALSVVMLYAGSAFSYIPQFVTATQPDHWIGTAVWNLNPSASNIVGGGSAGTILQNSFGAWSSAPNSSVQVSRGGDSGATAHNDNDHLNLVCFVCTSNDFGTKGDTLAITYDSVNTGNGQILDADIIFNPDITFLTNGAACPAGKNCADLQTIATHEIGHFFGLDHTGVVRGVMFPFAPDRLVTLGYDDVAGISKLYPSGSPSVQTSTISGTVRYANGNPVCGAHVFADSATAAIAFPSNIRKTPISAATGSDGTYSITGLPADSYTVTAEPLDGPVGNDNLSDYGPTVCGGAGTTIPTNFTARQH